jgi:hypothetical protein
VVAHSQIENIKQVKLKKIFICAIHGPSAMADQLLDSDPCVTDQSLMSSDQKQSFSFSDLLKTLANLCGRKPNQTHFHTPPCHWTSSTI